MPPEESGLAVTSFAVSDLSGSLAAAYSASTPAPFEYPRTEGGRSSGLAASIIAHSRSKSSGAAAAFFFSAANTSLPPKRRPAKRSTRLAGEKQVQDAAQRENVAATGRLGILLGRGEGQHVGRQLGRLVQTGRLHRLGQRPEPPNP